MRVSVFQENRAVEKLGAKKAPWSCKWRDENGKQFKKQIGLKTAARAFAQKIERELAEGTFSSNARTDWKEFRRRYDEKVLAGSGSRNRREVVAALNHFERICKPKRLATISAETIDGFVARRRAEPGKKPGSKVSPHTIDKNLRYIYAALGTAFDWQLIPRVPKRRRILKPSQVGRVISLEHLDAIYAASESARLPDLVEWRPGQWWQTLLLFGITTGWRIEEIIALRWADIDLNTGRIFTRAPDNKGKRDEFDHLPPEVLKAVKELPESGAFVFPWPHNERTLWTEFNRIQERAGIHLECMKPDKHDCTPSCHLYGFHSLRRAYATINASRLPAPVLQKKMRHKSFTTTLGYIAMADSMKAGAEAVFVPKLGVA